MISSLEKFSKSLGKEGLTKVAVSFAKNVLSELVSFGCNVINKFERRITGKGAAGAEKGLTLFISNEDIGDIITIVESLEKSDLLTVGATEIVRHEIIEKKTRKWNFWCCDVTYHCFINNIYDFFIYNTFSFFI